MQWENFPAGECTIDSLFTINIIKYIIAIFFSSIADELATTTSSLSTTTLLNTASSSASSSSSTNNSLHHSQQHQHIFQHQSSVSSTTSVQTVFQQNIQCHNTNTGIYNSNTSNNTNGYSSSVNSNGSATNPLILFGTSSSSSSFQSAIASNQYSNRLDKSGSITSLASNANIQIQMTNSSNFSIAEETLNIGDVADLLHPQHAIITGGRSRDGCPIITFPDNNNFHVLSDRDYEKLISYLASVPS